MPKDFINFGHGDGDPGAIGQKGTKEKDISLAVGMKIVNILRSNGEDVQYYQSSDLNSISAKANAWGADLFISIHCNSASDHSAHGTETYAYTPGGKGEIMAGYIQAEMIAVNGLTNRGVKFANYSVLRKTNMPAVLVELAFISNSNEEALLLDGAWQDKVALAIAKGILRMSGKTIQSAPTPVQQQPVTPPSTIKGDVEMIKNEVFQTDQNGDFIIDCSNVEKEGMICGFVNGDIRATGGHLELDMVEIFGHNRWHMKSNKPNQKIRVIYNFATNQ